MLTIMQKTFGGLSKSYYFRQLMFGALFPLIIYLMHSSAKLETSGMTIFYILISTILYPYSRFVYESIVGFIMGENVFILNALIMMLFKLITMSFCWCLAIFVAPIGLMYLYFYHRKVSE